MPMFIKTLIHNNTIIKHFKSRRKIYLLSAIVLIVVPPAFLTIYTFLYLGKVFPGISVAGQSISGYTTQDAEKLLANSFSRPEKIILIYQKQKFEIPLESIDFSYDYQKSAQAAYNLYRSGNYLYDFINRTKALFSQTNLGLRFNYDKAKLAENISVINGQVAVDPIYPSAKLVNNEIVINRGITGQDVDLNQLYLNIGQKLTFSDTSFVSIPVYIIDPTLSDEEVNSFRQRAENLVEKTLELEYKDQFSSYSQNDLLQLLDPQGGFLESEVENLTKDIASEINKDPQNPVFVFEMGRVKEFTAAEDGIKVEQEKLKELILTSLKDLENSDQDALSVLIPVTTTPSEYNTEDVNDLGIKELIGVGKSKFAHSIASRIHNISVASSHFNGVLIPPGKIFSFNATLGDVSEYTGYKQAYIIKDGKTVLGDGGGVCQVSTTMFRAVLDAGLPIIERRAHAYRVGYYEQDSPPGLDATVYDPTTDLKFKNDTPGHILIQTIFNAKTASLTFEIYGTSDGRVSTISKPVVTDVVPPPEDLYTDDPTLAAGEINQIDWKAWGAKVWFDYSVERDGETVYQKTFYSNYRPWQAVYLRGTEPVN